MAGQARTIRGFGAAFLVAVAVATGTTARAQGDPPFSAERPGFTNGVGTVAPGYFQFEYGYRYGRSGGADSHLIGDGGQVRAPLAEYSEFRLGLPPYFFLRGGGESANGLGDSSLSLKYRFRDAYVGHYGFALIAGTTVPTSQRGFGDSFWKPYASLEFSQPLSEQWELQASASYAGAGGRGRRFDQDALALNLGYSPDDRASYFIEAYRFIAGADITLGTYVDGGVTYMLNRGTQIDVNGGVGVTRGVRNDYFLGFGVARRW
jgi:hypothetical protein